MTSLQLPGGFSITQPFGCTGFIAEPAHPGCPHFHEGIDFGFPSNTPVTAPADGVVQQVVHSAFGYGNHVVLDVGNGVTVLLGHLASANVQIGQHVSAGQVIALSDSTGASTGPHLHFEVRKNNVPVDPETVGVQGAPQTSSNSSIPVLSGVGDALSNIPGLSQLGDALDAIGGGIDNLNSGLGGISSAFGTAGSLVGKVFDPATWLRAVLVIGGVGLVLVGGAWLVADHGS